MAVTSDRLLAGVKRRVTVPASQPLLTNADILAFADDCTKQSVVPLIQSCRQEFFVTTSQTELVGDQAEYAIPYRAMARTLRDLKVIDTSGNRYNIAQVALEDEQYWQNGNNVPVGFYFRGDSIIVVPTPLNTGFTLEFWWEMPPNNLVLVSDACLVVSKTDTTVTVSSTPSTFTTGVACDFISGRSGCATLGYDREPTDVTGNVFTFDAEDIPDALAAGDYIALAQETPVIQLPDEAYPYLETLVCKRVLNSISDYEGISRLEGDEKECEKNLKILLQPRVIGESTVVIPRMGLLRGTRGRFLTSGYYF